MLNVGILTSGGDCQALNAAMRGVVLSLFEKTQEIKIFVTTINTWMLLMDTVIASGYRLLRQDCNTHIGC